MLEALFGGPAGPLVIAAVRVLDMSLSVLRMVFAIRGQKVAAGLIGFIESLLWVVAVGAALQFLDSPLHLLGYCGGFALGNVVGIWVEEKLAFGNLKVQILSPHVGIEIGEALREASFGATEWLGQGRDGRVEVLSVICPRNRFRELEHIVNTIDDTAMVVAGELRAIRRGWIGGRGRRR